MVVLPPTPEHMSRTCLSRTLVSYLLFIFICLCEKPVKIVGRFSICVDHPGHDSLITSDGTPSANEDYVQYIGELEDLREAVQKKY